MELYFWNYLSSKQGSRVEEQIRCDIFWDVIDERNIEYFQMFLMPFNMISTFNNEIEFLKK